MARGKSFQEVQRELKHHLCKATVSVKMALDTWMQAVELLPPHMQNQTTEAATQLVQAALQEAPQIINLSEREQYAWLQKNLPGIGTAIQECVSRQLEISSRRIRILRSLPDVCQYAVQADEYTTRQRAENNAYVLLEVMVFVLLIVWPVHGLADVLREASGHVGFQGMTRQQQLQQSLQQGKALMTTLGCKFAHISHVAWQMQNQLQEGTIGIRDNLLLSMADAPLMLVDMTRNLFRGVFTVSRWLVEVGNWLLPHDASTMVIAYFICAAMASLLTVCGHSYENQESLFGFVRAALCKLLCHGELRTMLVGILYPGYVAHLLQNTDLTPKHFQDAGMTSAQLQQLLVEFGVTEESMSRRHKIINDVLQFQSPSWHDSVVLRDDLNAPGESLPSHTPPLCFFPGLVLSSLIARPSIGFAAVCLPLCLSAYHVPFSQLFVACACVAVGSLLWFLPVVLCGVRGPAATTGNEPQSHEGPVAAVPVDAGEVDEMQALVQQMYGTTTPK